MTYFFGLYWYLFLLFAYCRVPHLLGGVQPHQHTSHTLPSQLNTGVSGHRPDRPHHLHHPGSCHDFQRPGPALLLHHIFWSPTRLAPTHNQQHMCYLKHYMHKSFDTQYTHMGFFVKGLPQCWKHVYCPIVLDVFPILERRGANMFQPCA